MSRQFNPSGNGTTDVINFSLGNAPPDQGPITMAVLAKMDAGSFDSWMLQATNGSTPIYGVLAVNNSGQRLYIENDFDATGASGLTAGAWRWYVVTKASGNVKPRYHVWDLSGAWTHTDGGSNVIDGTGPVTQLRVGNNVNANRNWRGLIAVAALWTSALSDGQVEAAMTLNASATLAASPTWMVRLNQGSTATSVTDDTGGGGGQSSLVGTSVSADDPGGYNYNLTTSVDASGDRSATATATGAAAIDRNATGTVTATATRAGAATVDPGGQGTATAAATIAGAAAVTVNATGTLQVAAAITGATDQAVTPPATTSDGWSGLLAIYRENVQDTRTFLDTPIIECFEHRYRLEPGHTPGTLHCPFGGEVVDIHGDPVFT